MPSAEIGSTFCRLRFTPHPQAWAPPTSTARALIGFFASRAPRGTPREVHGPPRRSPPTKIRAGIPGLFAWCPGKAAWPRQRAQASDFGGLRSGSLPGRRAAWQGCIQTSPPSSPRSPASERNQAFCWFNCSFYCLSSS